MSEDPEKRLAEVVRRDGRYPLDAFVFLYHGLARAEKQTYGQDAPREEQLRHVSGQALCQALREEAIERWGLLAKTVLAKWGVRSTTDFGRMVFLLVDNGVMHKTDEDSIEDFRDVYDFDQAFGPEQTFKP